MSNLVIRTDATTQMGAGHLMRCLALAQAWNSRGGSVTFITSCENSGLRQRILDDSFKVVEQKQPYPDSFDWKSIEDVLAAHSEGWVVLDGCHFTPFHQRSIKEAGYKLLVIDDTAHLDHYYADLVLNQNINAERLNYSCEPYTRFLLGTKFTLLRSEFLAWRGWQRDIPDIAHNLLVTLGGSDPNNVTLKVIRAIEQLDVAPLAVRIAVGPANPYLSDLRQAINHSKHNLELLSNVNDMSALMAWADIAISAGGITSWELAFMGVPTLVITMADNHKWTGEYLENECAAINLGWYHAITENELTSRCNACMRDRELRKTLSFQAQKLIGKHGSEEVVNAMIGKKRSNAPENEEKEVYKFWNNRAGLGIEAGTKDTVCKRLEMGAIAGYVRDGMKVLDAGCGNGVTALELAENYTVDVTGFDFAEEMVEAAKEDMSKKKLRGECKFFVHELRNVGKLRETYDLVYTERALINLQSWEEQEAAIKSIVGLLKAGARYLMCENSQDALSRLNSIRSQAGLDIIKPPWHNRYLLEDEIQNIYIPDAELEGIENFASTYYFLSRVVNAWISKCEGKEPTYDAPINKLALNLPPMGDIGQTKLWIWKKTG